MAYVSANWGEEPNLQNKSLTITPEANWSGASTEYYEINPDSGYDALKKVNVRTPMLRDYTLMNVSQVETPSTVYNGDTARSNSAKMLRVAPSKTGMSYTNSYLEVPASSVMGNATADDVRKDKIFTSGSGIALTGTMEVPDLTDATATANDILSPKTAYIADGSKATGTIATRSASSETISSAKTYPSGYYPNEWTVTPAGGAKAKKGTFTIGKGPFQAEGTTTVELGFKPSYIAYELYYPNEPRKTSEVGHGVLYIPRMYGQPYFSDEHYFRFYEGSTNLYSFDEGMVFGLEAITDTGFVVHNVINNWTYPTTFYYFAIE